MRLITKNQLNVLSQSLTKLQSDSKIYLKFYWFSNFQKVNSKVIKQKLSDYFCELTINSTDNESLTTPDLY